jgi:hypothetical protein
MKRLRLFCILSAMAALLVGTALAGSVYVRGGVAHADSGGMAPGQIPLDALTHYHLAPGNLPALMHQNGHIAHGIPDIDSIPNFNGKYHADGFDLNGAPNKQWVYNMVGNLPQHGGATTIRAPIVPVSVDLLAGDGSVRVHVDANQYAQQALNSPIFQDAPYSSSSVPTQFTDAIQRAEFASSAKSDWHTLLQPVVEPGVTIKLPYGSYSYAQWISGPYAGQIAFMVVDDATLSNLLYPSSYSWPPDPSSVMGALESSGEITPQDITTFLAPPLFGFIPPGFIYAGFHWWDQEPGDASNGNLQRVFVFNYSSWVYFPGLSIGAVTGIQDSSVLSHEMSEIFNDPFVLKDNAHGITPWWSSGGVCQDLLETGDVIEFYPNAVYSTTMNGMTYHLQNEALLSWFEGMTPSDALGGAYSYPDTSILTSANPPNTPLNCGQ